jgi:hypothetical protein
MLFDLKGKRRRAVQVTYLFLALLMGVGLVGAGIGSDATGGLFDVFKSDGGGSDANKALEERADRADSTLRARPNDPAALATAVRAHYSLAATDTDRQTGAFGEDGKAELREAAALWKRYLGTNPERPDLALANQMVFAFDPIGLNQPAEAATAAEIVAAEQNEPDAYLRLVQYATLAGQKRKADLAGRKAIELAPDAQKKEYEQQVEQAKMPQAPGGTGAPPAGG